MVKIDVIEKVKREAFRRRLSHRTIMTYLFYIKKFLKFCNKDTLKITKKDVKEYLYSLSGRNVSGNTLNVALNSVKFMVEWVLHKRWYLNIKYSKTPKRLPVFLIKEEVRILLDVIENKKHRLMISLIYSAGLRVSELVHLRVRDFEFSQNYAWVRDGKGGKDRVFIVAKRLKRDIIGWIKEQGLSYSSYLFKGNNNVHISTRTVQEIVKNAAKKASIEKNTHPHTLRHSFATHLVENKYDIISVQSLLGHGNAGTTMTYVHATKPRMINVKSPFDRL